MNMDWNAAGVLGHRWDDHRRVGQILHVTQQVFLHKDEMFKIVSDEHGD